MTISRDLGSSAARGGNQRTDDGRGMVNGVNWPPIPRLKSFHLPNLHLGDVRHGAGTAGGTALHRLFVDVLGPEPPVAIRAWDGTRLGPDDPGVTTIHVNSPDALRRIVTCPGELGFARAYVAGDMDVEGSIFDVLALRQWIPELKVTPRVWLDALEALGISNLRPLAPPPEEAHLHGGRHSPERDAAAIAHHYDVSNEFYEMVLGDAMTYSCGLWVDPPPTGTLEDAQWAKLDLVCQKLALEPGKRLLDIGCGWGSMVRHAATRYGVEAVGVTLSHEQASWARERVEAEGLSDKVEIRVQDYRDIHDGPFDAISSIGMFEHVGAARLVEYFNQLFALVKPGGRVLNHAIARPPGDRPRLARRGFADRYVFPDGELHEVGTVISKLQDSGLEVRHEENLREHYAYTLREWVKNLEHNWDKAVEDVGLPRARIWRLYMAGSALGFEDGRIQIHQVLATRPNVKELRDLDSMPLRPDWNASPRRGVSRGRVSVGSRESGRDSQSGSMPAEGI
ncbi:MAG: cyclopropane-fatty-acyl-phospholipid synthase family protein [Microthrixaceae bacterium]